MDDRGKHCASYAEQKPIPTKVVNADAVLQDSEGNADDRMTQHPKGEGCSRRDEAFCETGTKTHSYYSLRGLSTQPLTRLYVGE